jgi:hypothetical protein
MLRFNHKVTLTIRVMLCMTQSYRYKHLGLLWPDTSVIDRQTILWKGREQLVSFTVVIRNFQTNCRAALFILILKSVNQSIFCHVAYSTTDILSQIIPSVYKLGLGQKCILCFRLGEDCKKQNRVIFFYILLWVSRCNYWTINVSSLL